MWRSVFLHEFLDTNIRNFQALPGRPTPASLLLTPTPHPALRANTVLITPGRGFEFTLAEPLDQVIGVSGRIRLRIPFTAGSDAPIPILRIGDQVEFSILKKPPVLNRSFNQPAPAVKALLRIGPALVDLGPINLLPLPPFFFTELRFDWHASGQAHLRQDGQLVGYHNAVAPAARLDVDKVVFGIPDASLAAGPSYAVGRVFVRALRRPDTLSDFARLFNDMPLPDEALFEKCYLQAILNLLGMVDRLRQFMSLIHQNLSQPWTRVIGPAEGPFTPEAVEAHQLATAAAVELQKMLRTRDFSTAEAFLNPFERFLRILHQALPNEFAALAQELTQPSPLPVDCFAMSDAVLEKNQEALKPLLDVLAAAASRVKDITGGP